MLRVKPRGPLGVRLRDERVAGAVLAICDRDPVRNVFRQFRVPFPRPRARPGSGAQYVGSRGPAGRLESLCYFRRHLGPRSPATSVRHRGWGIRGPRACDQGRRCSSVVVRVRGQGTCAREDAGQHWGKDKGDPKGKR